MRVLVTGGCGFIGSHLCERLAGEGHDVVPLDNMYTGTPTNLPERLQGEVVVHDVRMPLPPAIGKFERIYNLACPASPVHYQADPIMTTMTCVLGTMNVMEHALRTGDGATRVLHTSTSEVYGDPEVHPQPETYWGRVNPYGPRSCYDEGKRCAESLLHDYQATEQNADVRIARIFNTYGPRMSVNDGRVVSNFVVQALMGDDITIYGDTGEQTRSFCYVDDMVEGLVRLMESDVRGPVNLGNMEERTVYSLAKKVIELTKSASKIVHKPLPQDDPKIRRPDISRATSELGWKPKVAMDMGLVPTIAYFRERISA